MLTHARRPKRRFSVVVALSILSACATPTASIAPKPRRACLAGPGAGGAAGGAAMGVGIPLGSLTVGAKRACPRKLSSPESNRQGRRARGSDSL